MKYFIAALAFSVSAYAQTFNFNLTPVSLPGNRQTVVGTESGAALTVTPNFDLLQKDIVAPGQNFQYFSGGFNYRIPYLSKKLNNVSPTINGLKFQFGVTGSVGVDRITLPVAREHFGVTGGGFANYSVKGPFQLGVKIEYVKFPGLTNNNFTVALGPSLAF